MSPSLYTVTLTDLGTYEVTVAADDAKDAALIAKCALTEERCRTPDGMKVKNREVDANASLSAEQPIRQFRVMGAFSMDFSITVPAANSDEAMRHAKRIYYADPFPWNHQAGEDRVQWHSAREVVA